MRFLFSCIAIQNNISLPTQITINFSSLLLRVHIFQSFEIFNSLEGRLYLNLIKMIKNLQCTFKLNVEMFKCDNIFLIVVYLFKK